MANNSQFLSSSGFPNQVARNETFNFQLTFLNTGTETWVATGANKHQLGSRNPDNNIVWGATNRFVLPSDVPVNSEGTIDVTITAPNSNGFKSCQWGMVKEGIQWFGDVFKPTILVGDIPVSNSGVELPDPYSGDGLVSATICLTPQYKMDGTARKLRWTNNKGVALEIVGLDIWSGVQSTTVPCDVHAEVIRTEDGSVLGKHQFDRYAQTNFPLNVTTYFPVEPFVLLPDHSIDLFTHGTDLINLANTTLVSQHSCTIYVKNYILPEL